MAKFTLPVIHDNRNGWGPSHVPEQFKDTPYQPFSKGDRLGKVSTMTAIRTTSNFWVYRWLILLAVYTRIEGLQVRLTIVSRGQTIFLFDIEYPTLVLTCHAAYVLKLPRLYIRTTVNNVLTY